jgi:hypothetical protein
LSADATERPVVDAEPAQPVGTAPAGSRAESARSTAYRSRFAGVYLALAIVAGGAIGAFVVLMVRPDPGPPANWSTFVPEGTDSARLYQIINTIPQRYRSEDGRQLVTASVNTPQTSTVLDGQTVVLPVQRIDVEEGGDIETISAAASLQFTLCGTGTACAIDAGRPSQARFAHLQREAFELALYTFKYVDSVENVTLLMPPSRTVNKDGSLAPETRPTAVFLQRDDVSAHLERPLEATLAPDVPPVGQLPKRELSLLTRVTGPNVFKYGYRQAQDGAVILFLEPPGAGS